MTQVRHLYYISSNVYAACIIRYIPTKGTDHLPGICELRSRMALRG